MPFVLSLAATSSEAPFQASVAPLRVPDAFDAEAFFHFKGTYGGREMTLLEMKARQEAWAVKRVQRLWRRAWDEAHR